MKNVFKILIISLLLTNCSSIKNSNSEVVTVVTEKENLDKYVGKLITIQGTIVYSKVSTIIGVDISLENVFNQYKDLEGKMGKATGILIKTVVKKVDPMTANRGIGTFYRLKNPADEFTANVEIIK